ncbi:MAG TPA: hypothetical protein VF406_21090 [Thermodesulfobacteriota bacterium]
MIEPDADVGFVLEAVLREAGFGVLRRDRMRIEDCLRPEVTLVSVGLSPEATRDQGWLERLRSHRPELPLVVVASSIGGGLETALEADRQARVVYHPLTADEYLAAVHALLNRGAVAA